MTEDDEDRQMRSAALQNANAILMARQKAERELAEERERLRVTLASIGDGVISTDAAGRVAFLNFVAESLTGWPTAEAAGRPLVEVFCIVDESTRTPVENPALQALAPAAVAGAANHAILIARDGTERAIENSATPIRDPSGATVGTVLVFRDITERRRAEEARGELAAIVESSDDAIIGKSLDGTIRSWNAGAQRIFGYTAAEAVGRPITLIVPPDRLDEERSILARLVRGERLEHYETVRLARDGRRLDISLTVSPISDGHGRIVGASKVARDVTGRKRGEAMQIRMAETLGLALASADLGIWEWNPATDAVTLSDRAAELYGVVPGEAHTREGLRRLIGEDHRDRARNAARRALDERTDYDIEYPLTRSGGDPIWVVARGRAEYDAAGAPTRMIGVVHDITPRKRAEGALRESERQQRFLAELAAATQPLVEPAELMAMTARLLAEHLGADRCAYAEVEAESVYAITGDYSREVPSIVGRWPVAAFGEDHLRTMLANEPYVVDDSETDPRAGADLAAYRATQIRAVVCVPLHKGGKFTAAMAVHQREPRRWTEGEVGLVKAVVARCWEALERVRVTGNLREKDERLKLLVDRTRDYAVVMLDREGVIVDWAGGAETITGFTPAEAVGQSFDILFTPEDLASRAPDREREIAARAGRAEDKRWHQKKDGGQFFADGVLVSLHGDDGVLRGFGKVFRDATDRKRAEEGMRFLADASASLAELVDYESTLRRISNLAVGGFADWCVVDLLDAHGERQRLATARYDPGPERPTSRVRLADEDAAGALPHVLRTGESEMVTDLAKLDPATAPQGAERIARLRAAGIHSYLCVPLLSRGVIGGMTFLSSTLRRRFGPEELRIAQTLAERVTSSIENAWLYRELQDQDRRKDEFLATLAHELRNPLAPVRSGLKVLGSGRADPDAVTRTLEMMERQLGQMVHLIDDLLDVARVSSGKVVLRREWVELETVFDSAVESTRQIIEANGHAFVLNNPDESLAFDGDRTRLVQVVSNLLNNAAKYTPPGGRIALSAVRAGSDAVIRVTDTGIGIPPEMLPKIFEMFTQVGTSLDRAQGGLGIGLTLVKRLVEMHGGTISARSDGVGKGSEFAVRLPLSTATASAIIRRAAPTKSVADTGKLAILVVDDNRDAAESLAMLLEIGGHEIRTAHDGPDALRTLESYRPQVILLDIGLPGMNGYEVARRIRASVEHRGVTLAALTGWGQEEDRRRTKEVGFDHHLVKPADPADVERILAGVGKRLRTTDC